MLQLKEILQLWKEIGERLMLKESRPQSENGGDGEMAKERKGQSTSIIGWDKHILASIKKEREEEKKLLQKNKKYNG